MKGNNMLHLGTIFSFLIVAFFKMMFPQHKNRLKPSSKICLLTVPRWYFYCGSFCVMYVLCLSCFCVSSLLPCGHLLEKGCLLAHVCDVLLCFSYIHMWYPGSGVVLVYIDSELCHLSYFYCPNLRLYDVYSCTSTLLMSVFFYYWFK